MAKLFCFLAFVTLAVHAQENAVHNLSPSLRECYVNKYLLQRDNRLPHTLNTFLAILRKIENTEGLNMDLRSLSVALLHRFRQDGIVPNPLIPPQDGVSPYAPIGNQFYRHAHTLRFIQGNALLFPNNSITDIERCTLHFMMSSSIEVYERGDEGKVCKYANAYRYARDVGSDDDGNAKGANSDVETLSSDEIRTMTNKKDGGDQATLDPNSLYPEYPPNHPDFARLQALPKSKCPVENGVIKTPWGVVSPGLVLAGIAAATQPQTFSLQDVQTNISEKNNLDLSTLTVDTKWIVTLAGDLAEAALVQGPLGEKIRIGATGNWNSTALPRWYFLNANEKLEMTTAEIRGDLDGLILANEVNKWYSQVPNLRLSQIFDMYYSKQGFFDSSIRACDRRTLFTAVATNDTMARQAYIASLLLSSDLVKATLAPEKIENYAVQAVNELARYVPTSMNKDLSCSDTNKLYDFNQMSVDLTIILDTNWPFYAIQPILANLLENIDLNPYNSNFTLINGHNGVPIINSTFNILEFNAYNSSQYENIIHGFDLPKSLDALYLRLMDLLDNERNRGVGGARSNVVLIIPYTSTLSNNDKDYSLRNIARMSEKVPDTTLLIMTYGSKDTWSALTQTPSTDMFSIVIGDTEEALTSITNVVSRIKQVPKRLINTQCGSNYAAIGSSNSYVDYVAPNGTNFYRLQPNYFFRTEGYATIKIQSSNSNSLTVCSSRGPFHANSTVSSESCASITSETHAITVSCADATMIHECPPLYISVTSNSTGVTYQCTDPRVCRYPYQLKYTISYENLLCASGTNKIVLNSLILIVLTIFVNLY